MENEKKYFGGWWLWVGILVVVSGIVLTGLSYIGIFGRTVVERKVFENSYQYTEARKTAIATYEAQLAEINRRLSGELDSETRNNLESQAAAMRIRLSTERSRQ